MLILAVILLLGWFNSNSSEISQAILETLEISSRWGVLRNFNIGVTAVIGILSVVYFLDKMFGKNEGGSQ
jgi:hypothetical protein